MSLQFSQYQAQAVGKCVGWGLKKCWEWTKQEEKEHREKEEYEKIYSRLKEQQEIRKQDHRERQEILKQKRKEQQEKEEEDEDKKRVLKILENINIDDIIKEFQIKNNKKPV
jgi:uncharacterized membrane-anchored protein